MMALNYADRETLRPMLLTRCKEAVRKFLLYTQGGGGTPSQERIDWCTSKLREVSIVAEEVSHYVTSEPDFIDTGTSITDAALQSRVESVLVAFFMPA